MPEISGRFIRRAGHYCHFLDDEGEAETSHEPWLLRHSKSTSFPPETGASSLLVPFLGCDFPPFLGKKTSWACAGATQRLGQAFLTASSKHHLRWERFLPSPYPHGQTKAHRASGMCPRAHSQGTIGMKPGTQSGRTPELSTEPPNASVRGLRTDCAGPLIHVKQVVLLSLSTQRPPDHWQVIGNS